MLNNCCRFLGLGFELCDLGSFGRYDAADRRLNKFQQPATSVCPEPYKTSVWNPFPP